MTQPYASEKEMKVLGKELGLSPNMICCVCLAPIKVMAFRGTGVCCEDHRKTRDNDHEPFKAVNIKVE